MTHYKMVRKVVSTVTASAMLLSGAHKLTQRHKPSDPGACADNVHHHRDRARKPPSCCVAAPSLTGQQDQRESREQGWRPQQGRTKEQKSPCKPHKPNSSKAALQQDGLG